jgi:hypothetical protein
VRLGLTACRDALNHDQGPVLPFRLTAAGWVFPWLR